MEIILSKTARQSGFGQDYGKRVVGLTADERKAAQAGVLVAFDSGRPADGRSGTRWRVVQCGRLSAFYPRVPTQAQMDLIAVALHKQADERLLDPASTDNPDFEVTHD